jgi:hypothetical protein
MASFAQTGKALVIALSPGAVKPEEEVSIYLTDIISFQLSSSAMLMVAWKIMHAFEVLIQLPKFFLG